MQTADNLSNTDQIHDVHRMLIDLLSGKFKSITWDSSFKNNKITITIINLYKEVYLQWRLYNSNVIYTPKVFAREIGRVVNSNDDSCTLNGYLIYLFKVPLETLCYNIQKISPKQLSLIYRPPIIVDE